MGGGDKVAEVVGGGAVLSSSSPSVDVVVVSAGRRGGPVFCLDRPFGELDNGFLHCFTIFVTMYEFKGWLLHKYCHEASLLSTYDQGPLILKV